MVKMWGSQDVFVGVVRSICNSEQSISIYSCNFRLRNFLIGCIHCRWIHGHFDRFRNHELGLYPLKFLAGFVFATGSGALLANVVQFTWAIVNRQTELPTVNL